MGFQDWGVRLAVVSLEASRTNNRFAASAFAGRESKYRLLPITAKLFHGQQWVNTEKKRRLCDAHSPEDGQRSRRECFRVREWRQIRFALFGGQSKRLLKLDSGTARF
jgi:hypothetical protein